MITNIILSLFLLTSSEDCDFEAHQVQIHKDNIFFLKMALEESKIFLNSAENKKKGIQQELRDCKTEEEKGQIRPLLMESEDEVKSAKESVKNTKKVISEAETDLKDAKDKLKSCVANLKDI